MTTVNIGGKDTTIHGLRKAVSEYNTYNKGAYSPWYARIMFDYSDGTMWTDVFYDLGHNWFKRYHSDTIVCLSRGLLCHGKATAKDVISTIKTRQPVCLDA